MSPALFLLVSLLPSTPPWLRGLFQFLISTLPIVASEVYVLSFNDESRVLFMSTHRTTVPEVFLGLRSDQRGPKLCASPSSTVYGVILSLPTPTPPHITPHPWSARALTQVFLTQSKLGWEWLSNISGLQLSMNLSPSSTPSPRSTWMWSAISCCGMKYSQSCILFKEFTIALRFPFGSQPHLGSSSSCLYIHK